MTLVALFAVACTSRSGQDGDSSALSVDLDGDGFETPDDCADDDAAVHPGAEEHCDGLDNDCDGDTDGADAYEASTWYADADADGFGNPDLVRVACEPPSEYFLDNALDCDDEREDAFPGAQEYCDGIDDDCDGAIDEDDALDKQLVYVDADGDGAGDPDLPSMQCFVPDGYAAAPNDCDDADASISPYGTEVCNDGIDNDCNGTWFPCGFEGEKNLMLAEATIEGDEDDHLGLGIASGDVDGDGSLDVAVSGGPRDGFSTNGVVYVLGGPVDGVSDASGAALAEMAPSYFGTLAGSVPYVLALWDADGDGYDDVLAGSTSAYDGTGGIHVFLSPSSGSYDMSSADFAVTGSGVGFAFEPVGDVDGDGEVDFAVGAAQAEAVYLLPGPLDRDTSAASAAVSIEKECALGYRGACGFGGGVGRAGDLDGDGSVDLVVGTPYESVNSYSFEGAVYVYAGPFDSDVDGADYAAAVWGSTYRGFGTTIDIVPDLDGDGYDELLFGMGSSYGYLTAPTDPGQAGIFYGPVVGELERSDAQFLFEGESGDATGISIAMADTNADGVQDLVVGDPVEDSDDVSHAGAAIVFTGPLGTGKVGTADATGRVEGIGADEAGTVVENLGDLNGDGVDDLGIGAPSYGATAGRQGAAFLVFGGGM